MGYEEPLFYVVSIVSASLIVILKMFYNRMRDRFDWLDEIASDDVVNEYIVKGVMCVKARLLEEGEKVDISSFAFVEEVLQYVVFNAPKALKKVGFTDDYLKKLIKAYLVEED